MFRQCLKKLDYSKNDGHTQHVLLVFGFLLAQAVKVIRFALQNNKHNEFRPDISNTLLNYDEYHVTTLMTY